MEPLRRSSMCRIKKERDERSAPTLGFFKPFEIKRLLQIKSIGPQKSGQFSRRVATSSKRLPNNYWRRYRLNFDTISGVATLTVTAIR
jgi:hypothetical protein